MMIFADFCGHLEKVSQRAGNLKNPVVNRVFHFFRSWPVCQLKHQVHLFLKRNLFLFDGRNLFKSWEVQSFWTSNSWGKAPSWAAGRKLSEDVEPNHWRVRTSHLHQRPWTITSASMSFRNSCFLVMLGHLWLKRLIKVIRWHGDTGNHSPPFVSLWGGSSERGSQSVPTIGERIWWWPVWVAVPTLSACSAPSWETRRLCCDVSC